MIRRLLYFRAIPRCVALVLLGAISVAADPAKQGGTPPPSDRKPAEVMSHEGAAWLERPEREQEEHPGDVIKAMHLRDGDVACDMGCGTGYFARRMARAVAPHGKVYGVDIQPEFIAMIKSYCAKENITNVIPVLGEEDDPKLPPGSIDWMVLVDVYHEFQHPQVMLAKIRDALKPGGKVALVEYRLEGDSAKYIKTEHRMSVEQVMREWQPAGFELVDRIETLPSQHLFIFRKATASGEGGKKSTP